MRGPERTFTVRTYSSSRTAATSTDTEVADVALDLFKAALHTAGHTDEAIESAMRTFTLALMGGANACNFLDPDLTGSVEIQITTVSKPRPEGG